MDIESISLMIAAFVNGSVAIASLMHNFRSRLVISFSLLALGLFAHDALAVLETFDFAGAYSSPRMHIVSVVLLGPIFLLFLREVLVDFSVRLTRVLWFSLLLSIGFIGFLFSGYFTRFSFFLFTLSHVFFIFPVAYGAYSLFQYQKNMAFSRERIRLRYAFWGLILTLFIYGTNAIYFLGFRILPLGTLSRVFYLIFLFQLFIKRELVLREEMIAKLSLFGGISLILSAIYSILVSWVGERTDLFYFNTLIASFVVIILFDPVRNLTQKATRKLLSRVSLMLEVELNQLSTELMGVVEPKELVKKLSISLKRSIGVDEISLFLLETDGLSYESVNPLNRRLNSVLVSDSLVEYMSFRRGRPFLFETLLNDRDRFRTSQQRRMYDHAEETMRNLVGDLVIPFVHASTVVGFLVADMGERWTLSSDQLRLFVPLSRQIALHLKNAQSFSRIRDREKLAAVGEMAAGLAHEIRNPLGAIKGACELIGENLAREKNEFLKIILEETDRLSSILSEFLDYAKPRRGFLKAICEPLKVIEHTVSLVQKESKVKIEVECQEKGFSIQLDPETLKQILLNLMINAVQAMDGVENGILRIRLRRYRPRNFFPFSGIPFYKVMGIDGQMNERKSLVEIEVSDNGCGISEEDVERIFVPFFTTKPKGTGLGLSICHRLVEGMGGSIHVRKNIPQGAVFTIRLPEFREEIIPVDSIKLKEYPA